MTFLGFIGVLCVVALIATWIGAIFDMWRRADMTPLKIGLWIVFIVLFPIVGVLAYIIFRPSADKIRYRGETIT